MRKLAVALTVAAVVCGTSQVASAQAPKIAAVGDMGCDSGHNHWSPSTCHQKAVSDLVFRHGYDAFLPLGDNQYECGSARDFHRVYAPTFGRVKHITHPVVGNHEYWAGAPYQKVSVRDHCDFNATGYYHYFGKRAHRTDTSIEGAYRWRIGHWLMLAMNSECAYGAGNTPPCWRQTVWLKNRMQHFDRLHKGRTCELVYMHKPPLYPWGTGVTKPFLDTFANYGGDVLLAGHEHTFRTRTYRGVDTFTVGTGGKGSAVFGVLSAKLGPGKYTWRFVPARGDSWTSHGSGRCHA